MSRFLRPLRMSRPILLEPTQAGCSPALVPGAVVSCAVATSRNLQRAVGNEKLGQRCWRIAFSVVKACKSGAVVARLQPFSML